MKNADMTAMPNYDWEYEFNGDNQPVKTTTIGGLTKRETFAMNADVAGVEFRDLESLGEFIGRDIDGDSINDLLLAQAQCSAKLKVMYADALLAELEA